MFLRRVGVLSAEVALLMGLLGLCLGSNAAAQSTTDGAIGGVVTDPSGSSLPNAQITVRNVGTNSTSNATSDSAGRFLIAQLQPGQYSVEVAASGFSTYSRTNVIVEVGRATPLDVVMSVAAQTQSVEVSEAAPVITTDRADLATNINNVSIDNLPVNGRRWSTFALGTPGAVPDGNFGLVSFRGVSGLLNNNTVDGGDNNQAFFAEEKGRTRISYSISQSSIREFQVNTSNYSAEYGRSAGGVVNAVTKSGTNRLHGEGFWFYRSSDFGATNPFATIFPRPPAPPIAIPIKPNDKRHQFGGNIGGPIIKDKLFFFFNADQQLRNFPGVANASSPKDFFAPLNPTCAPAPCTPETVTIAARGITPAQANSGLTFLQSLTGVVPRTGDQLLLFPKLDWNINSKNRFSAEYNRMRWASPAGIQTQGVVFRGREAFGNDFVKDDTVIAKLISSISSTTVNDFRFQYGRDFEFQNTQSAIAGEPVSSQGVSPQVAISGSAGIIFGKPDFLDRRAFPDENSYQFADTVSVSRGKHLFKFGADIIRFHDLNNNLFQESGAYSYNNRVDFISDYVAAVNNFPQPVCGSPAARVPCYSSFKQGIGPTAFDFTTIDYGFFAQDDWRISPRLTLNLGLRWDFEKLPKPQIPNPGVPATSQFPSDKNNFGPRLGFALDLTGRRKTVVRGGYGIYYGRIINSTISNAITNTGMATGQLQFEFKPAASSPRYPNILPGAPAAAVNPPDIVVFGPNTQNPMIHEFDLVFEYQIATNTAVSVSYLGSLGRNLPVFIDRNLAAPTQTITYTISGGPDSGKTFTLPVFTGKRPNTAFNRITTISNIVSSKYNAIALQFTRRMTEGLQFQSFYTYSQTSDTGQSSQTFTASNNVLNPFDLSLENGRSNFDIHHRFGASAVWQPTYFQSRGAFVRTFLDGFTIAPIVTISSGVPYTGIVSGNAPGSTSTGILGAGGTSRPPFISRNAFQMPRIVNVDLRIAKKFKVSESVGLELFGEAFNLFNHINATAVGTRIYGIGGSATTPVLNFDPQFGTVTASSNTINSQRQIQIGARFVF